MSISKKIVIPVILINLLSLTALLSTSIDSVGNINIQDTFTKQIAFIIIGWILYFLIARIDLDYIKFPQISIIIFISLLILLILTSLFGPTINYAKRWLILAGVQIQPSEFVKIAVIIYTAVFLLNSGLSKWKAIVITSIATIIFAVIVFMQPHGSMALIIMALWFLTVITILPKQLINISVVAVILMALASLLYFDVKNDWGLIDKIPLFSHQKNRITAFISPDKTADKEYFNVDQARVAIGSGGLLGKGFGQGSQSRLRFLPEYKTDFLFAAFCEEFGLIGGGLLLVLYCFLIYNIMIEAMAIPDQTLSVIVFLFGVKILLEMFINIGTNTGLIPATGIPLPLFSAGGSVVIATFVTLGIVQNAINRKQLI
jgi:rod shape determining protein RodA